MLADFVTSARSHSIGGQGCLFRVTGCEEIRVRGVPVLEWHLTTAAPNGEREVSFFTCADVECSELRRLLLAVGLADQSSGRILATNPEEAIGRHLIGELSFSDCGEKLLIDLHLRIPVLEKPRRPTKAEREKWPAAFPPEEKGTVTADESRPPVPITAAAGGAFNRSDPSDAFRLD